MQFVILEPLVITKCVWLIVNKRNVMVRISCDHPRGVARNGSGHLGSGLQRYAFSASHLEPQMLPASSRNVSTSSTNPISGYPTYGVPAIPPFSVNVSNVNSHVHQPGGGQLSSLHQGTDPNSPELFKEHLALAQDQVIRVQSLAREVLSSMWVIGSISSNLHRGVLITRLCRQNAYNPSTSPKHTSGDPIPTSHWQGTYS